MSVKGGDLPNQDNKSRCTFKRLALGCSCFTQRKCRTLFAGLRTAIARCVSSGHCIVIAAASIASKTHHSAELVDALCKSVDKADIQSCESKTELTECKTFLGLAMLCLKMSPLECISRPSVLTHVCPVLVSKANFLPKVQSCSLET